MIRPDRCSSKCKTLWILVYCFALVRIEANMQLKMDQREIEVFKNDSVLLKCRSNASTNILWKKNENVVSKVEFIYSPYRERFSIRKNQTTGDLNLWIGKVKLEDSGIYKCVNPELMWEDKPILLVVIDSIPVCSSNMPHDGFIGPNTCKQEKEQMIFSCSVSFTGSISTRLRWRLLNDSQVFDKSQCINKSNKSICTMALEADPKFDGSVFLCETTKAVGRQYNCTSIIKVQYFFAKTELTTVKKSLGEEASCVVETNQAASFFWKLSNGKVVSYSQRFVFFKAELFSCEVSYRIRNVTCTNLCSTYDVPEGENTHTTRFILGIIISLLIPPVFAFVTYILIKRKRKMRCKSRSNGLELVPLMENSDRESNAEEQRSARTLSDLLEEIQDVIIRKSYLILALKDQNNNPRDAEIISLLASVNYLWFQEIIKRKRGILFQISAYFKKVTKTSTIIRNNRQFLLEAIHPTNDLIVKLFKRKYLSNAKAALLKSRAKRTRHKSNDLLNLMKSPTTDQNLEIFKCFQEAKQWTIARVILNGGIVVTVVTRSPDSVKQLIQSLRDATVQRQPSCSPEWQSEYAIEIINYKEDCKNITVFWIWVKSQSVYDALKLSIESGRASLVEKKFIKTTSVDNEQLCNTLVTCQTATVADAQRIKEHRDLLLRPNIDINLFIDRLRAKGVIDYFQEIVIKQEKCLSEQISLLLNWLEDCGVVQNYEDFLLEMKDGIKVTPECIRKHKNLLIERLDPDSVLEVLSYEALTSRKMLRLNDIKQQHEKAERAIDDETNQSHLANYLAANGSSSQDLFGDDRPLTEDQFCALNNSELIERINPHDSLLSRLFTNGVISARQMNIISAKRSDTEKNKALLDIIRCSSKERYKMFILSLQQTDHEEVVQLLLDRRVFQNKYCEPHVQNKSVYQVSEAFATILVGKTPEEIQNILKLTTSILEKLREGK